MGNTTLLSSSLAKKYWMSVTGLFLCTFLLAHLVGNLQLLIPLSEGGDLQFNAYAHFMTSNPAVKLLSYITYFSILFHAVDGLLLALQNKKARPVAYAKSNAKVNATWTSRNMALLGSIMLVFIIAHMKNFWYEMHWGSVGLDAQGNKNIYGVVTAFFADKQWGIWFTLGYVISMVVIAFHLFHGFQSGFQSLGLRHSRYTPLIQRVGASFALLVPLAFAYIPIHLYLTH